MLRLGEWVRSCWTWRYREVGEKWWDPCEICGDACLSQLESMKSNDDKPWDTCGGCYALIQPDGLDDLNLLAGCGLEVQIKVTMYKILREHALVWDRDRGE